MNWPSYLIQVNIYLVLFYTFYVLVLQNETFFKWNRIFLVSSGALSLLIPLMQSDWVRAMFVTEEIQQVTQIITINPVVTLNEVQVQSAAVNQNLTVAEWVSLIYLAGVFIALLRFFWQLSKVSKSFNQGSQAQSFFTKIKVSDNLPSRDTIVKHEEVHVSQLHSADVIFFELIGIINWFNPVVYAYKKSVKYIHEFIADEAVAADEKSEYALLLVSRVFGIEKEQLTNNFFNQSLLKKRIMMLHKSRSRKVAILKYGLSVPLFAAMLIFSSAKVTQKEEVKQALAKMERVEFSLNLDEQASLLLGGEIESVLNSKPKINAHSLPYTISNNRSVNSDWTEFLEYVSRNTIYPAKAVENKNSGRVYTAFTVNNDGEITDIKTLKGLGDGLDAAVIKVIKAKRLVKPALAGNYVLKSSFSIVEENNMTVPTPKNKLGEGFKIPEGYIALDEVLIIAFTESMPKTSSTVNSADSVFTTANVDKVPEYPGGEKEFLTWVGKNYKFPQAAEEAGVSGRVIVNFIVEKNGALTNVTALRHLGYGTGEAAVELLKSSKNWKSGTQKDGTPVRVHYTLPLMLNAQRVKPMTASESILKLEGVDKNNVPLFIIDGKESTHEEARKLKPESIQSFSIFKDADAAKKYGEKAKNGVIEITTHKK